MTTYTDPSTLATAHKDPVTVELMEALKNNPVAIAEQSSGAPKIASKNLFGVGSSSNIDFTVTGFLGARFFINFFNSGIGSKSVQMNVSDGTFDTAVTIVPTVGEGDTGMLHGYWDASSGSIQCAYQSGTSFSTSSQTFTKTSGITTLRIVGISNLKVSAHVMPDGGESP